MKNTIKNTIKKIKSYTTIGLAALMPYVANADFYEAPRSHTPGTFQVVALTAKHGDLEKKVVSTTLKFKNEKVFALLSVPYINEKNNSLEIHKEGIGDLEVEVGKPLKFNDTYVMPLLRVRLPTANEEMTGDQFETTAELATTTVKGQYIINLGTGYTRKEHDNEQTFVRFTPGYDIGNTLKGNWKVGLENVAVYDMNNFSYTIQPLLRYTAKDTSHITIGPGITINENGDNGYNVSVRVRIPLGK